MTTSPSPMTLTARCPEDVLAMVPVVLGFVPAESVVMLTFGAREAFHARIDLPEVGELEDVAAAVETLLLPSIKHRVPRVLFVVYSDQADAAEQIGRPLEQDFGQSGIEVVQMLRSDGSRWFPLQTHELLGDQVGVPYDSRGHPFSAEAVLHGRVMLGSRAELAATIAPDGQGVQATADLMAATPPAWDRDEIPPARVLLAEGAWVQRLLGMHLGSEAEIGDADLVRLLRGIDTLRVRDAAWALIDRRSAQAHIEFWSAVVRRSPTEWVTAPATLLGWAAWQHGHGALAWCAVERAESGQRDYTMLDYLATVLENAVPPSVWSPTTAWDV